MICFQSHIALSPAYCLDYSDCHYSHLLCHLCNATWLACQYSGRWNENRIGRSPDYFPLRGEKWSGNTTRLNQTLQCGQYFKWCKCNANQSTKIQTVITEIIQGIEMSQSLLMTSSILADGPESENWMPVFPLLVELLNIVPCSSDVDGIISEATVLV